MGFAQTNLSNLHREHLSRLLSLLQVPKRMRKVSLRLGLKDRFSYTGRALGQKNTKNPFKKHSGTAFLLQPPFLLRHLMDLRFSISICVLLRSLSQITPIHQKAIHDAMTGKSKAVNRRQNCFHQHA